MERNLGRNDIMVKGRRRMTRLLLTICCIYLGYCALLWTMQRRIMFPADLTEQAPQQLPAGGERIFLALPFGKVEAWYLPPKLENVGSTPKSAPAILFAHGNAELIDLLPPEFADFPEQGVGVLLVEYPGYGRSDGAPGQRSITAAMTAAYDHLAARPEINPEGILLFGRSLGGGAVCRLSLERPSAGMVLISTFTSARWFAKGYLVPPFLVRDPFDNLAAVRRYSNPVLLIHGASDELIPFFHAEILRDAASDARLLRFAGGHNEVPPTIEQQTGAVLEFMTAIGILD